MNARKPSIPRQSDKIDNPDKLAALYRTFENLATSLQSTLATLPRESVRRSPTLVECVNELLVAKAAKGVRRRYLVQLRLSLCSLVQSVGDIRADDVRPPMIELWLHRPQWGAYARRSYLIDARTLFSFCERRGYVRENPAALVELPRPEPIPPRVHTPADVSRVLLAALREDADVCRLLSVQYFAGLRPAEAARLTESEIREGYIVVEAAKAKTRQRRVVPILPTLAAWLATGGRLPVQNRVRRYYRVRESSGVVWSHDVTRHSFVSYHLAHYRNAAETALVAGHSETVLHAHYRALVSPRDAAEFWRVLPPNHPAI